MKLILLMVACFIVSALSSDSPPPVWPERFSQSFIQRDTSSKIFISGKLYYDIKNNRQRCDVQKDYFDLLCSSVSQSQNSSCSQIIMNDKLYIYLPDENLCCKCCTTEEGCKITPRDWLKDFQYIGPYIVNWEVYDRWSHYDMPRNITYSASQDEYRIPKCIETGSYGIDFLTGTYTEEQINESVFNIPNSCEKDCPQTSFCANFRQTGSQLSYKGIFSLWNKFTGRKGNIQRQENE